jgi:hypothetical protein
MGLGVLFWLGFYKYAAPDGVGVGTLRGDVPAGAFLFLAAEFLSSLPAGDRNARADGRRSAPSLPRWPGTRWAVCQDPAKGSLGWTNGAKGV